MSKEIIPQELLLKEDEAIKKGKENLEKLLANSRLIDDYYFSLYAQCYPEDFSMIVSTFLDKDIKVDISTLICQNTMNLPDSAKDVRFDVSVKTKDGGKIVMEVESKKKFPELRLRYYMSRLDAELLYKGKRYEDLKNSYIIVVSPVDMREQNKPRYFVKSCYVESLTEVGDNPAIFEDGQSMVYINASYKNEKDTSKLADLIHDFTCRDPDKIKNDIIRQHSQGIKNKGKEHDDMMATAEKYFLRLPLYNGRLLTEVEQMEAKEEGKEEVFNNIIQQSLEIFAEKYNKATNKEEEEKACDIFKNDLKICQSFFPDWSYKKIKNKAVNLIKILNIKFKDNQWQL